MGCGVGGGNGDGGDRRDDETNDNGQRAQGIWMHYFPLRGLNSPLIGSSDGDGGGGGSGGCVL